MVAINMTYPRPLAGPANLPEFQPAYVEVRGRRRTPRALWIPPDRLIPLASLYEPRCRVGDDDLSFAADAWGCAVRPRKCYVFDSTVVVISLVEAGPEVAAALFLRMPVNQMRRTMTRNTRSPAIQDARIPPTRGAASQFSSKAVAPALPTAADSSRSSAVGSRTADRLAPVRFEVAMGFTALSDCSKLRFDRHRVQVLSEGATSLWQCQQRPK